MGIRITWSKEITVNRECELCHSVVQTARVRLDRPLFATWSPESYLIETQVLSESEITGAPCPRSENNKHKVARLNFDEVDF